MALIDLHSEILVLACVRNKPLSILWEVLQESVMAWNTVHPDMVLDPARAWLDVTHQPAVVDQVAHDEVVWAEILPALELEAGVGGGCESEKDGAEGKDDIGEHHDLGCVLVCVV